MYVDTLLYCTYLSEVKLVAEVMTSSGDWTKTGILRQPGDLRTLISSFMVSWSTLGGHMSILVTTTNTGTLRARARPRCSVDIRHIDSTVELSNTQDVTHTVLV